MKNTKKFLALSLIPALIPFSSYAQSARPDAVVTVPAAPAAQEAETKEALTQRLWKRAKEELNGANISTQLSLPTLALARGLDLGVKEGFRSLESLGGKYAGIDVWNVNLAAHTDVFGPIEKGVSGNNINIGGRFEREVVFIQQFNKKMDSLFRLPYDPITKIPKKASMFNAKSTNLFTKVEEPVLKPGDFISYSSMLTLGVGAETSQILSKALSLGSAQIGVGVNVGINFTISGEFDIHTFVMSEDLVRTRIMIANDRTTSGTVGLRLVGYSALGDILVDRIISPEILQGYISKSKSDLFLADYIFNVKNEQARDLYDSVIGSKYKYLSGKEIWEQLKKANPFARDAASRARLIGDLQALNAAAAEDAGKAPSERRITKVTDLTNENTTRAHGGKVNLLVLSADFRKSSSTSYISMYGQDPTTPESRYQLDASTSNSSFRLLFWGGTKHYITNSLLSKTDALRNKTEFVGLQTSHVFTDGRFSRNQFNEVKARMQMSLPDSIYNSIQFPNWDFSRGDVINGFVQYDITFNDRLFSSKLNISEEQIRSALETILNDQKPSPMAYDYFVSAKGNLLKRDTGATDDGRKLHFNEMLKSEYDMPSREELDKMRRKDAYALVELKYIPGKLAIAFDSNRSMSERYGAFLDVMANAPVFKEISALLLAKIIPENELQHMMVARLAMSARNQTPLDQTYPSADKYQTNNLFRELLEQNNFLSGRKSYNLRYYIKEDGSLYSLDEIITKSNIEHNKN